MKELDRLQKGRNPPPLKTVLLVEGMAGAPSTAQRPATPPPPPPPAPRQPAR